MPMLLKGENGNEFELALIESRTIDIQDGYGDNAQITLSFRVATESESWEETAPLVNYFEIKNLYEWLSAVGRGPSPEGGDVGPEVPEIELLGPELRFLIVKDEGNKVTLRIDFHLDDRPRVFEVDAETDELSHVDLRLGRDAVRRAVEELKQDLETVEKPDKDDLEGDEDLGQIRIPDEDLAMVDREEDEPPFPGFDEDNAGGGGRGDRG